MAGLVIKKAIFGCRPKCGASSHESPFLTRIWKGGSSNLFESRVQESAICTSQETQY